MSFGNVIQTVKKILKDDKEFGIRVIFYDLLLAYSYKLKGVEKKAVQGRYNAITDLIYRESKDIIKDYKSKTHSKREKIGNGNVWVFWDTGIDTAPDIVKICINSIKQNIGNRQLIILDNSNYKNYTTLDPRYAEMVQSGEISKQLFSDLLRLNLLYNQGGIWLDATMFLSDKIPEYISDLEFYTIRHGLIELCPLSKGLWSVYTLAVGKHSDEFKLFYDVLDNYFKYHKKQADYLLIDYTLATCCDHIESIYKMFLDVPIKNSYANELRKNKDEVYSDELYKSITDKTWIHKFVWKQAFKEENGGKETIYGHLKKMYLTNA